MLRAPLSATPSNNTDKEHDPSCSSPNCSLESKVI